MCKKKDFGKQVLQNFLDALFDDEQGSDNPTINSSLVIYMTLTAAINPMVPLNLRFPLQRVICPQSRQSAKYNLFNNSLLVILLTTILPMEKPYLSVHKEGRALPYVVTTATLFSYMLSEYEDSVSGLKRSR